MSEALVPAAAEPVVVADGEADVVLPALIVDAGPDAVARFLEFFAGRIANARTRAAYGRAVGQFLAWCEARGLGLAAVSPLAIVSTFLAVRLARARCPAPPGWPGSVAWLLAVPLPGSWSSCH